MSTEKELFQSQIFRLLDWERRKRGEGLLIVALFYALLAGLIAQPFISPGRGWAWLVPVPVFIALVPYFFIQRRWRDQDTARTLAALDRALRLDERATTAWELLRRNETRAVALLVLRQAGNKLKSLDSRSLFPRLWTWHGYFIGPLLALWLALLWFDPQFPSSAVTSHAPPLLAQTLREFARKLQEKAQSESLPQTLKAGQKLEKFAEHGIDAKTADEQFKSELAGITKKMAEERNAAGQTSFAPYESRQQLEDLRAELEAAQNLFKPAPGTAAAQGLEQSWQDRLAGLTQLKKYMEKQSREASGESAAATQSFLDKLEKQVGGELDRRTLLEAEQYLQQLARRGPSQPSEAQARADGGEEDAVPGEGQRDRNAGSAPGEEPGKNADKLPSLPDFQGGARAHVKGTIGEGERAGIVFKAKPAPGKSNLSQDEVIASYRRQAEAELNTEKIPEELKETIKRYFLSLEKSK